MANDDFEKDREERRFRRHILEALLVSSLLEDNSRLPTIKEFILSEVVNGIIEYIGGNAGKIDYQKFEFDRDSFERELCKYFEAEMKTHSKGKLNPKIKRALTKLCGYYYEYPATDKPYPYTELYSHFEGGAWGGICPVIIQSSFSLPQKTVIRVQTKVLPALSIPERRDVGGIGKAMRKYIDRDLKLIGQTYHW